MRPRYYRFRQNEEDEEDTEFSKENENAKLLDSGSGSGSEVNDEDSEDMESEDDSTEEIMLKDVGHEDVEAETDSTRKTVVKEKGNEDVESVTSDIEDGSDSDDAPEEVSFSKGQQQVLKMMQAEKDSVSQGKKRKKEKQQELLAEQKRLKKMKQKDLLSKRLPEEFLDSLSETPKMRLRVSKEGTAGESRKAEFEGKEEGEKLKEDPGIEDSSWEAGSDYIPLSTTGGPFKVISVEEMKQKPNSIAENAKKFRYQMLYGERVKREPAKAVMSYKKKQVVSGGDVFVRCTDDVMKSFLQRR